MADEVKDAESFNAPIVIEDRDEERYIGCNPEYRNSADHLGAPMKTDDDVAEKYFDDALEDEKAAQVVVSVYGAQDSEIDPETGEKREGIKRMGEKSDDKSEEPASAYGDEDVSKSPLTAPNSAPASSGDSESSSAAPARPVTPSA